MIINTKSIVAVLDLETSSLGRDTKALLAHMEKMHRVVTITHEMPKSAVLAGFGDEQTLYISQLSTATLLLRNKLESKLEGKLASKLESKGSMG